MSKILSDWHSSSNSWYAGYPPHSRLATPGWDLIVSEGRGLHTDWHWGRIPNWIVVPVGRKRTMASTMLLSRKM